MLRDRARATPGVLHRARGVPVVTVAELLALYDRAERITVRTSDVGFYIARGFRVASREGQEAHLDPPTALPDVRAAASVCLWHGASDRVLLGRRRTPPWPGFWAFPGGGLEPGESEIEAARRELAEETGLLAAGEPLLETLVYVSSGEGERVYSVRNFVIEAPTMDEPSTTVELEPRWVTLAESLALAPMAAGTERVLARVARRFGAGRGPATG